MQLFAEPAATRFDLRFAIRGIPVRVHPLFWIATLLLALDRRATALSIATWLGVSFVSILVHELGHALAFRRFGARPRISIHGMGGLAIVDAWASRSASREIAVAAAGPFAGFALAALTIGITAGTGHELSFLGLTLIDGAPIEPLALDLVVSQLLLFNLLWGAINLAPVHPLDGSQIFYHAFFADDPVLGRERSARLSMITAGALAIAGYAALGSAFLLLLFAYLALASGAALKQLGAPLFVMPPSPRRAFRQWRHARSARKKREERARVDARLKATLAADEAAPDPHAEIAREADALLAKLNAEIARDRKKERS